MKKYKNNLCEKLASCIEILKTSGKFDDVYSVEYDILNIMLDTVNQLDSGGGQKVKRHRRTKQELANVASEKLEQPASVGSGDQTSNKKKEK